MEVACFVNIRFFFFNFFLLFFMTVIFIVAIVDLIFHAGSYSNAPKLDASYYAKADMDQQDIQNLEQKGGWLEELGSDYQLIRVIGEKKDNVTAYSSEMLVSSLENREDQPYYYSVTLLETIPAHYFMLKIPREHVSVSHNYVSQREPISTNYASTRIRYYFYFSIGLMLFFIFLYSYWVARRIKKPLREISQGLHKMTLGDYSTRIHVEAEEEFKQISNTFNYMANVIEETLKEKRQIEESKQRLIVDVTHDLKTPITSIQGYAQALMEGRAGEAEHQQRYLGYIYQKSNQVTQLIQSILELLKLDSPDYRLQLEYQNISDFLREVVADSYGDIEQRKFTLVTEIPEKSLYAWFEAESLNRVIVNLITNALKYNPSGTRLRVELKERADHVLIDIADTGVGIPEHLRQTVFDPFVRVDESRSGREGRA